MTRTRATKRRSPIVQRAEFASEPLATIKRPKSLRSILLGRVSRATVRMTIEQGVVEGLATTTAPSATAYRLSLLQPTPPRPLAGRRGSVRHFGCATLGGVMDEEWAKTAPGA
jgi:hypothetical protein